MKIKRIHIFGIIFFILAIFLDIYFFRLTKLFWFILGIAIIIGFLPFFIDIIVEVGREKEKEEMFLEFCRALLENVKGGTPISKSIVNLKGKNFGVLTKNIQKLANQILIGIPVRQALNIFARDTKNIVIKRSVALISQAEEAGGAIDRILEFVARSVSEIEEIKKEQKAMMYSLVIQGYIIFFVFVIIMLVVELKIIPMSAGIMGITTPFPEMIGPMKIKAEELTKPFFALLIVQGLFTGLVIGKLTEGNIKAGIKHSFILMIIAWLMTTGVRAFQPS